MEITEQSNVRDFCTPILVEAGWILDPSSVIHSAKQLSIACKRNVLLRIETGHYTEKFTVEYAIQPDVNYILADITGVAIRPM